MFDYNEDERELWMPVHSLCTIAVALSRAVWSDRMVVRLIAVVGRWVEGEEITLATPYPTPMVCSTRRVQEWKEEETQLTSMRLLWLVSYIPQFDLARCLWGI